MLMAKSDDIEKLPLPKSWPKERLLAIEPPVNKFPDFVDRIVARMVVAIQQPTKRKVTVQPLRRN
jgi:hypothetical protein